ncbi:unnamed protein product, partial [Ilex paraguariensis]
KKNREEVKDEEEEKNQKIRRKRGGEEVEKEKNEKTYLRHLSRRITKATACSHILAFPSSPTAASPGLFQAT